MKLRALMTIAMMTLAGALLVACGSDGDSGTDTIAPTDTTTDTPTDTVAPSKFTGQLVDFASKTGRKGVDLRVLNNDTGADYDLVNFPPFKSGADGRFELALPAGTLVGFEATGQEDVTPPAKPMVFQKTYMFNIPSDAQAKRIYAVNTITYKTAPMTAGIVVDKTKGILAGTVYFKDPASGEEQFVGCATVEAIPADGSSTTPVGDVRYFDPRNDLPGSLSVAQFTTTGLAGTSRYIIGNLPLGRYKIVVKIDGVQVNPGAAEVTIQSFADSIAITNIYVTSPTDATKNPTPARAECTVDEVTPT